MSDASPRTSKRFADAEALRAAWQGDVAGRRLMVADDPVVELLTPLIVDLYVGDAFVASLWAQAVFRVPGGGELGVELHEIPDETVATVERFLGAHIPQDAPASGASDSSRPMALRYKELKMTDKMQIALRGDRDGRFQVIREGHPQLLKYLLQNPKVTAKEISQVAKNSGTPMDVLKMIADHPQHTQNDAVRLALVKNPRTPIPLVRKHIDKLPRRQIAQIAKSDHVRAEVGRIAKKIVLTRRS